METCSPHFPWHENAYEGGLTRTPALPGLHIHTANSGKCENDSWDPDSEAVIKTQNGRNEGAAHAHMQ